MNWWLWVTLSIILISEALIVLVPLDFRDVCVLKPLNRIETFRWPFFITLVAAPFVRTSMFLNSFGIKCIFWYNLPDAYRNYWILFFALYRVVGWHTGRLFWLFICKYVGRVVHILWTSKIPTMHHVWMPYMITFRLKIELNGRSFGWALSAAGTLECHRVILELYFKIEFEGFSQREIIGLGYVS